MRAGRRGARLWATSLALALGLSACTGTLSDTRGTEGEGPELQDSQSGDLAYDVPLDRADTPELFSEVSTDAAATDTAPADATSPDTTPDTTRDTVVEAEPEPPSPRCDDAYAYLHGDLWPMWYNMRMACDPQHRAAWRCERQHGAGAPACSEVVGSYNQCLGQWPCPNWGVCAPVPSDPCGDEEGLRCDTRLHDYDSPATWGTYYGLQWSSPELHRFMTIKVRDSGGGLVAAFSSNPGSGDAYMDGQQNSGVGPEPQGLIQLAPETSSRFGSFACIRLPAGQPLTLEAAWMNDFCHTCSDPSWSSVHWPCRTSLTMTFEAGGHYLWTYTGLERMETCDGPPADIRQRLPAASCSSLVSP